MKTNANPHVKYQKLFILLAIFAVLVNIKSIFTDYNIDSGYAIATSYRQLLGDRMIADMWEPHQTSAFLCTFLIWLYTSVTQTTTGLVLFLHIIGVTIKALLGWLIYHTLKPFIHPIALASMCIFFFIVTPKGMVLPEFSNMQLWFSMCLFCCLIKYFNYPQSKRYLFCSGLFLCLEIISYPSCIIIFVGVIALLLLYSKTRCIDILLFTGECFLVGLSYISLFIFRIGWENFILNCRYIIMGDGSHNTGFGDKFIGYAKELGDCILIFFILGVIAYIIAKLTSCNAPTIFFILLFVCDFLKTITSTTSYFERFPIYIPILLFSMLTLFKCSNAEKCIYVTGFIISFLGFGATLILTNLSLIGTLNYLTLAMMMAFIPLTNYSDRHTIFTKKPVTYVGLVIFLLLTIFHYGYVVKCMGGLKSNILNVGGIVKSGPAIGIVSEYMGAYIMNTTIAEWKNYINPGDNVLIVSAETLDAIMYLYQEDVEISMDSTICTPTYNEKLLTYWELHPEKLPNVVIVECWYGDMRVNQDSWIMNWLESEFDIDNYIDGAYWRYYRK